MTFLNWTILFGLLAIAIPVVIHLLNRRRAKVVDWGAMRFLLASVASRNRRVMIEEILLMILRCLTVAVLVLAMARPYLPSRSNIGWVVILGGVLLAAVVLAVGAVLREHRKVRIILFAVAACMLGTAALLSFHEQRFQQAMWSAKGEGKDIAIVIDASASMTLDSKGVTNFQRAIEEAKAVVGACRNGDEVALILAGPVPRLVSPPVYELPKILQQLGEVGPIGGTQGVLEAMDLATAVLDQGHNPQKKIILITDAQDVGWRINDETRWKALTAAMVTANRPERPEVIVRTLPLPPTMRNLAVVDVKLSRSIVGTDRPVRMEVTVTNTGTEAMGPAGVDMIVDGLKIGTQTTNQMPASASETVRFDHRFLSAGAHTVEARLSSIAAGTPTSGPALTSAESRTTTQPRGPQSPGTAVPGSGPTRSPTANDIIEERGRDALGTRGRDARATGEDDLPADNQALRVVYVIKTLPVLIVDGRPAAGSLDAASAFIYTALAPRATWPPHVAGIDQPIVPPTPGVTPLPSPITPAPTATPAGDVLINPTIVAAADIATIKDFAAYRVVVLANVPTLDGNSAAALARFVQMGGGLLIAPGDQASQSFYANWPAIAGGYLAPANLGQRTVCDRDVHLSVNSFSHPALKLVADQDHSDIDKVLVRAYWPLQADEKDPAIRVAGLLDNGRPFMVERKVAKGCVLMTAFSLDSRDSNFCSQNCFVTLIHELTHYLAAPAAAQLNFAPGGEAALPLTILDRQDPPSQGETLGVTTPSGRHGEATVVSIDGQPYAVFRSMEEPGLYHLEIRENAERGRDARATGDLPFAVLNEPAESKLSSLSNADLARVNKYVPLFHAMTTDELTSRIAGGIPGQELWRYLALAALLALLAEIALTRWITIQRRTSQVPTVQFGSEAFDADTYRAKAKQMLAAKQNCEL